MGVGWCKGWLVGVAGCAWVWVCGCVGVCLWEYRWV